MSTPCATRSARSATSSTPTPARINRLNVYPVPDGDTGTNMARTLDAVVAEMDKAPAELGATCDAISYGALMGARGNSGVILSQILRGIASTLKAADAGDRRGRRRGPGGGDRGRLRRRAHPGRGHDPDRRAGVRRSGPQGRRFRRLARTTSCGQARVGGQTALDQTPELLPVLQGRRRRRRRRCRVPAAARRRPARRRRRAAAGGRAGRPAAASSAPRSTRSPTARRESTASWTSASSATR